MSGAIEGRMPEGPRKDDTLKLTPWRRLVNAHGRVLQHRTAGYP